MSSTHGLDVPAGNCPAHGINYFFIHLSIYRFVSIYSIHILKDNYPDNYDQIQASTDIPVPHFFDTSEYLYVGRLAIG
jgi:hypothetical protein